MKKIIIIFLFLTVLASCRTVKKMIVKADSSVVRTSQASEKWDRETITDYGYPQQPVINLDELRSSSNPDSMLLATLQMLAMRQLAQPAAPVIIRQIVRDAGEKQLATTEDKTVSVVEKQVEKTQPSPWLFLGIGAGVMLLVFVLVAAAYKIIKSRILAAVAKVS